MYSRDRLVNCWWALIQRANKSLRHYLLYYNTPRMICYVKQCQIVYKCTWLSHSHLLTLVKTTRLLHRTLVAPADHTFATPLTFCVAPHKLVLAQDYMIVNIYTNCLTQLPKQTFTHLEVKWNLFVVSDLTLFNNCVIWEIFKWQFIKITHCT